MMKSHVISYPRLLADVGGTNIRLALQTGPTAIGSVTNLNVSDFPTLQAAVEYFLHQEGNVFPIHAAIGLPNPVTSDHVKLTNHNWAFSIEATRQKLGWQTLLVLNDLTALALALPKLTDQAFVQVHAGDRDENAPKAVIGPGTGLGISGLVPSRQGGVIALAGEGGHMEVAPQTEDEWIAWRAVQRRYGRVSAERLLCGAGISDIHSALSIASGAELASPLSPESVMENALHRHDSICRRTFEVFCGLLGSVTAAVALLLGARGGVYIGGGIVPRFVEPLMGSSFQARFESAGRLREYLADIPIFVITASHAAIHGLQHALNEVLDSDASTTSTGWLSRGIPSRLPSMLSLPQTGISRLA